MLEDLKTYDEAIYASLKKIKECDNVDDWDLTFTANETVFSHSNPSSNPPDP